MINTEIPGEIAKVELEAIALVAELVPEHGVVLEVGSYLGRSAWHWSKNVPATAKIICLDPWDGYRGSSLELFKHNLADCQNVTYRQGHSPDDFGQWNTPIDLYFEDAVHKNPVLEKNIAFWSRFLKKDGIICGHDYSEKFPDVMTAALTLARQAEAQLHVVRSFWCVLPSKVSKQRAAAQDRCAAQLAELSGYRQIETDTHSEEELIDMRRARVAKIPSFKYAIELQHPEHGGQYAKGGCIPCIGNVTNTSGTDWPIEINGMPCLKIGMELHNKLKAKEFSAARVVLEGTVFRAGETRDFSANIELPPMAVPGTCEITVDLVYDHVCWFARKGATPARLDVEVHAEILINSSSSGSLTDRLKWKQYVPEYNPHSPIGITSPTFQEYEVSNPSGLHRVRSMLSMYEIGVLYAAARDYTGEGEIVDLGPLVGLTTNAFARGLMHNTRNFQKRKRIYSYDLFLLERMDHFLDTPYANGTGSVFPKYLELNWDFIDYIIPIPGEFLKMSWTGKPIEILFIDLAKSHNINRHLIKEFFPSLIPEKSIVIQQDYVHVGEYWIALTMEHFADYFELLYCVFGATGVFRLKYPIPQHVLLEDIESLPLERTELYFDRAMEKATPTVREILRCCKAANYIRFNAYKKSSVTLSEVDFTAREADADPTADFRTLIEPQFRVVEDWLKREYR